MLLPYSTRRIPAPTDCAALSRADTAGAGGVGDEPLPAGVLRAVVSAVHAVGGRVAVHSRHAAGGAAAVAAGPDSLEHGMCLDPYLGLQGLAAGAPADAVGYDTDPRTDLGHPRAVVLRGQLRHRRP